MEMAVWILFCLFSSIGLVQCGIWFRDAFVGHMRERRSYHVIPLYDDAGSLEQRVRRAVSLARADGGDEHILLVDMGLGEECVKICEKLLHGIGGVYICALSELEDTIRRLDNLQNAANDVE